MELSSIRPSLRLMPMAAMPRRGRPTPVMTKPMIACHIFFPASCPMYAGKIRFPAPKNRPKSMVAMSTFSFFVNRSFIPITSLCVMFAII